MESKKLKDNITINNDILSSVLRTNIGFYIDRVITKDDMEKIITRINDSIFYLKK